MSTNLTQISSSILHAGLVIICQIFFMLFCEIFLNTISPVLAIIFGSLFGVGFYFGREVAQHERKVGTPPWYSGFKIWEWSLDSKLDLLFPLIVGILMPIIIYFAL